MSDKSLLKKIKKLRRAIDELELTLTQDAHRLIVEAEQRGIQKAHQDIAALCHRSKIENWESGEVALYICDIVNGMRTYPTLEYKDEYRYLQGFRKDPRVTWPGLNTWINTGYSDEQTATDKAGL